MKGRGAPMCPPRRNAWQSVAFAALEPSSLQVIPLHVMPGTARLRRISALVVGSSSPAVPVTIMTGSYIGAADERSVGAITASEGTPAHTYVDEPVSEDSVLWAELGSTTGVIDSLLVTVAYEC